MARTYLTAVNKTNPSGTTAMLTSFSGDNVSAILEKTSAGVKSFRFMLFKNCNDGVIQRDHRRSVAHCCIQNHGSGPPTDPTLQTDVRLERGLKVE